MNTARFFVLPLTFFFTILMGLFLPSKISAQTTCQSFQLPVCVGSNPCTFPQFDSNCNPDIDIWCQFNPFCIKYTGDQCCTSVTLPDGTTGGLGYDYCQSSVIPPGNFCANNWASFQCCSTPTPTPTPSPAPAPCVNQCTPNASWCLSNTTYNACDAQIDGCWYGGTVRDCPSGYSCDWNSGTCVAPTPVNHCAEIGYSACTPGQPSGSCTLNGQTCTGYTTYECGFNGQSYCGPPFTPNVQTCDQPCTGPPPTPSD